MGANPYSYGHCLEELDTVLEPYRDTDDSFPFMGGAVGYVTYELKSHFALYLEVIVIDKKTQEKWAISHSKTVFNGLNFESLIDSQKNDNLRESFHCQEPQSNFSKEAYIKAIKKAKNLIYEGDLYQLNLSHRFSAAYHGELRVLYEQLRMHSQAPYSAYLDAGNTQILSASPELFIHIQGQTLTTRPIKGTTKRGVTSLDDSVLRNTLLHSEKNRSELIMIVDLERNDLGRICLPGSIQVSRLIELESYAQVTHLVSTITGELSPGISHARALRALFPGGSITGAPKTRAMQRISEIETVPREVYTGCIGYIGFNQHTQFNIAIRTLYAREGILYFHCGGGIVADSDPEEEWEETLLKAKGIQESLVRAAQPVI